MSLFRRKKPGKVFPVKISTMDAELEFSLDYKVTIDYWGGMEELELHI